MRYQGLLLKEGFADEVVLKALTLAKCKHQEVKDASRELKKRWTVISFDVESSNGDDVAAAFIHYLKKSDWFVRLSANDEVMAVFAQKTFKYSKVDGREKAAAGEFGRSVKIPDLVLHFL